MPAQKYNPTTSDANYYKIQQKIFSADKFITHQ